MGSRPVGAVRKDEGGGLAFPGVPTACRDPKNGPARPVSLRAGLFLRIEHGAAFGLQEALGRPLVRRGNEHSRTRFSPAASMPDADFAEMLAACQVIQRLMQFVEGEHPIDYRAQPILSYRAPHRLEVVAVADGNSL